jgi:TrmH family RNA methyltransferase
VAIASRQNPIVARYRAAAHGDTAAVMLLDGVHLVSDALDAGVGLREAAVTAAADENDDVQTLVKSLSRARVNVVTVTTAVMNALSPVRSSSAIVALADRPPADAVAVFARAPAMAVIAVDVQDPGNLGAIIRVAEAGGAAGVIVSGVSADPFGWKALRGSMGSTLRLPVAQVSSAADAIAMARKVGYHIVATVPRGGRSPFDVNLARSAAVLIGGEGPGLSAALIEAADERVTIPMEGSVESLNSAVAAALIVYEGRRQRNWELGIRN